MNSQIAKSRELRLRKEQIEEEETIREELLEYKRNENIRHREMEDFIKDESKAMENRIKLEDLEKAIEEALANPVDYEYAIDDAGHIYRGRETKSVYVDKNSREKIPRPIKENEKLLHIS